VTTTAHHPQVVEETKRRIVAVAREEVVARGDRSVVGNHAPPTDVVVGILAAPRRYDW